MDDKILLSALAAIPVADLNYPDWIAVGMALKAKGADCSTWDEWSRADTRYHSGECEKKWATFNGSSSQDVAGGTIIQMAKDRGWTAYSADDWCLDWNSEITDGESTPAFESKKSPSEELIEYLSILFKPDEYVAFVSNDSWKTESGKWLPFKSGDFHRTAGQLIDSLRKYGDDLGATIGDWHEEAGAWIRFNPVDGKGVSNSNVTRFTYALVESDTLPIAQQERVFRELELPIACLVNSGGKSIHAIVRVDAPDYEEYKKRVVFLYDYLAQNGIEIDKQNKNPSRLSRMPGVTRNGVRQSLIATNIGCRSWADWVDYIEGVTDDMPDVESLSDFMLNPPPLPEELIEGILRRGHKMLISGSSKAGKSFLLMELCVAIAEGREWLGFQCKQGKVLYVNLEIDKASCGRRFVDIYNALGLHYEHAENIGILHLRGHAVPLDKLVPKLTRRVIGQNYDAIIIDPIYKVITGDENNASEMANFCNQFDKICTQTGCAVIYCHHHSKGAQGSKRAMDRASGSGVFARDPDAQLDMIELAMSDYVKNNMRDGDATAWRLESSLREFKNIKPVNFWFEHPIHRVDTSGTLDHLGADGSAAANLSKSKNRTLDEEKKEILDSAFNMCIPPVKITDLSNASGRDEKTIRRYISRFCDTYWIENGIVGRSD